MPGGDLGTINVKVQSEGVDDTSEQLEEMQSEEGGMMNMVSGGQQDGGGDGMIGQLMNPLMGMFAGIMAIAGILLSMEPIQKMLSAFMKVVQAFFIPVASMLMSLFAPVMKYLLQFLADWYGWTRKEPEEQAESVLEQFLERFAVPSLPGEEEEEVELDWLFNWSNWEEFLFGPEGIKHVGFGGLLDWEWPSLPDWSWPDWSWPGWSWPSFPDWSWPDWNWPDWDWPDIDFSWPSLPDWSWPSIPAPGWLSWIWGGESKQAGGMIPETGPYMLHEGEAVFNEDQLRALRGALREGGGETNIQISGGLAPFIERVAKNPNIR